MSNKTQLATNNTQLASLIQELNNKAAGGGGASLDTCTVVFNYPVYIGTRYATVCTDGATSVAVASTPTKSLTLENVVCGSFILLKSNNAIYEPAPTISGGGQFINIGNTGEQGFEATNTPGGTMTVDMYDAD